MTGCHLCPPRIQPWQSHEASCGGRRSVPLKVIDSQTLAHKKNGGMYCTNNHIERTTKNTFSLQRGTFDQFLRGRTLTCTHDATIWWIISTAACCCLGQIIWTESWVTAVKHNIYSASPWRYVINHCSLTVCRSKRKILQRWYRVKWLPFMATLLDFQIWETVYYNSGVIGYIRKGWRSHWVQIVLNRYIRLQGWVAARSKLERKHPKRYTVGLCFFRLRF